MTNDRTAKKTAREHAAMTGVSFTAARRATRNDHEAGVAKITGRAAPVGRSVTGEVVWYEPRRDFLTYVSGATADIVQTFASLGVELETTGHRVVAPDDAAELSRELTVLFAEVTARRKLLHEHAVNDVRALPAEVQPAPVVVMVPVLPRLIEPQPLPDHPTDWECRDFDAAEEAARDLRNIADLVPRIARTATAVGFALIVAGHPERSNSPYAHLNIRSDGASFTPLGVQTGISVVSMDEPILPSFASPELASSPSGEHLIAIAQAGGNNTVFLDRAKHPGLIVTGYTGSGKSVAMGVMAVRSIGRGEKVFVFDEGKQGIDYAALTGKAVIAADEESTALALDTIDAAIDANEKLCVEHGVSAYDDLPLDARPPRIMVIVDFLVTPREISATQTQLERMVEKLAASRGTGVTLAIASQNPSELARRVRNLGNLERILFGDFTYSLASSTFRDAVAAMSAARPGVKGRAVYEAAGEDPVAVQGFFASEYEIEAELNGR